jgi:hypothetical protein
MRHDLQAGHTVNVRRNPRIFLIVNGALAANVIAFRGTRSSAGTCDMACKPQRVRKKYSGESARNGIFGAPLQNAQGLTAQKAPDERLQTSNFVGQYNSPAVTTEPRTASTHGNAHCYGRPAQWRRLAQKT